jgi:hypothetical protein
LGFRFRKSIKLAPGVRVNLGKKSVSVSAGPRNARVNVSKRGVRGSASIPKTGIGYTTKGCLMPILALLVSTMVFLLLR